MDFIIRILVCLFLVEVAVTVIQPSDVTADAVDPENVNDHAASTRSKRAWVNVAPRLLKGTRKVVAEARILWRVQNIRQILLKDATLQRTEARVKVYTKRGSFKRAGRDFFGMSLRSKSKQTSSGDMADVGTIGNYVVRLRKQNPACKPYPCSVRNKTDTVTCPRGNLRVF